MKLLLIVITLSLAAVSCTVADRGSGSEPPSAPSATAPTATATSGTTVSSRCGGSLEGCYGYAEMGDYLEAITPMIEGFFLTEYSQVAAPRDIVYIARGQGARTACGTSDSGAYEYCSANRTIYIGQDLLWAFYRQAGDAAPAIGLAHEWAHHLQYMLDLPAFGAVSQSVNVENQADCIAGAWAKYANDQGWLEEQDDLKDASTLLQLIGSRETTARDHGTAAERLRAFELGYDGEIAACNSYFPRSPIA